MCQNLHYDSISQRTRNDESASANIYSEKKIPAVKTAKNDVAYKW